ncbi:MAG: exodeoxyribonuclease VII large subunit [Planctomycetales bacterium]|nr:exodeoxyribonuclease VII large subunit [Planctomycetales bacterium]
MSGFSENETLSISELNLQIRNSLQQNFGAVWVTGEITDLSRPQSGHIYLSLKDSQSQIRAVLWRSTASRLPFDLHDGMQVVAQGSIDVYPPRGTYQLILKQVEPLGVGALQLALQKLQEKLAAEGLFDPSTKRRLPAVPRHIAVVSSPTGAAIRDFLQVLLRRWPQATVSVLPTRVQGEGAEQEIASAVVLAQQLQPRPDVLVVTRGGGSLEDLWCFNSEKVVRAVASCRIPTVSAIGHEIDVTLCDLAADVRALTPTEAAELISPDQAELRQALTQVRQRMEHLLRQQIRVHRLRLDHWAERPVLRDPLQIIRDRSRITDEWAIRLNDAMADVLFEKKRAVDSLTQQLDSLSPLNVLRRGYSVSANVLDGTVVRSVEQMQMGDQMETILPDGRLVSRIESIRAERSTVTTPVKRQKKK